MYDRARQDLRKVLVAVDLESVTLLKPHEVGRLRQHIADKVGLIAGKDPLDAVIADVAASIRGGEPEAVREERRTRSVMIKAQLAVLDVLCPSWPWLFQEQGEWFERWYGTKSPMSYFETLEFTSEELWAAGWGRARIEGPLVKFVDRWEAA